MPYSGHGQSERFAAVLRTHARQGHSLSQRRTVDASLIASVPKKKTTLRSTGVVCRGKIGGKPRARRLSVEPNDQPSAPKAAQSRCARVALAAVVRSIGLHERLRLDEDAFLKSPQAVFGAHEVDPHRGFGPARSMQLSVELAVSSSASAAAKLSGNVDRPSSAWRAATFERPVRLSFERVSAVVIRLQSAASFSR